MFIQTNWTGISFMIIQYLPLLRNLVNQGENLLLVQSNPMATVNLQAGVSECAKREKASTRIKSKSRIISIRTHQETKANTKN